uniref:Putative secreted protein n=1 Tax=Ixodes ricinus TaxID=34613 RepID=A0A6B0UGG7_IXORI
MVPALPWLVGTLEALRFANTCCKDVTGEVPLWCSRKTESVIRNRRVFFGSEGSRRVRGCATTSQGSGQRCVDFGDLVLFGATRRCDVELKRSWCVWCGGWR